MSRDIFCVATHRELVYLFTMLSLVLATTLVICEAHERKIEIVDLDNTRVFRYYYEDELVAENPNVQTTTDDEGGVTFHVIGDKLRVKEDTGHYVGTWPHPAKIISILMECTQP